MRVFMGRLTSAIRISVVSMPIVQEVVLIRFFIDLQDCYTCVLKKNIGNYLELFTILRNNTSGALLLRAEI